MRKHSIGACAGLECQHAPQRLIEIQMDMVLGGLVPREPAVAADSKANGKKKR